MRPTSVPSHHFRSFDAHHRKRADQFAFDHGGGGEQELFAPGIGLGQDVVPMIEANGFSLKLMDLPQFPGVWRSQW